MKRRGENKTIVTEIFLACISLISFYAVYHIWSKDNPPNRNSTKRLTYSMHKRGQNNILPPSTHLLPNRIEKIIESKEYVGGKKLGEIKHAAVAVRWDEITDIDKDKATNAKEKPPMSIDEITTYLNGFISDLSAKIKSKNKWTADEAWEAYRNLTYHTLYKWDQEYLKRMPERRLDDSLYFSLVSYRDENCLSTISNAYAKAERPEKLFVGLVQQNCVKDCKGAYNGVSIDS